ncbi:class II fumarate hydratase [Photobacterium aphoticum]|uniref:Fumarate hydratase class II n=1 Tax=Photobacterium aphoticum TaxID=754436 RepID=A0A0J1GKT6_9GAMM|nr:class II fumarate hydratase [Photobacterium aphoticum]KLV00313.1 aspartate ammonia-lyase [Photobacterium aphoticum]PSU59579.1 class II fumarate hydratase [Photobacterium aphoticum]GHA39576.1 fumarate hydratase class II [Photobacterium aphoticum]
MTHEYRIETDSMGDVQVPKNALYRAQTQRAINNFPLSGIPLPPLFIQTLAYIKQAAARSNLELGLLEHDKAHAIIDSCQLIIDGQHLDQFPIDTFQTGSGTSSNMNANEVIATLASIRLGHSVDANDDVNMGQSSNDVIPTAIQVSSALACHSLLFPAIDHAIETLAERIAAIGDTVKTGRTHLMDAMPITLGQELAGWQTQLLKARKGIEHALEEVTALAQGGTAVGTGINTAPEFAVIFANNISVSTEVEFTVSDNFFYNLSSQDAIVALSGQIKTAAVALMKMSNDLRWMNSGPLAGLREIELEGLQPGSSIMPGKVNPVIPESTAMIAAQVIGNDTTITVAGQSGNFQLNVMLPLIAHNILQSIELLANGLTVLADKALATFTVNDATLQQALAKNPILVTALNPIIGYAKAAAIAKKAYAEQREIIDVAAEETEMSREQLTTLLNPYHLTQGGVADQ